MFGRTRHPAVSLVSDKGSLRLPSVALASTIAPCGLCSPSRSTCHRFATSGFALVATFRLVWRTAIIRRISKFLSSASASLPPDFKGFHFYFRGGKTSILSAFRHYRPPKWCAVVRRRRCHFCPQMLATISCHQKKSCKNVKYLYI